MGLICWNNWDDLLRCSRHPTRERKHDGQSVCAFSACSCSDGLRFSRGDDHAPAADWSPVWSPDGTRIAFTSERDGNAAIYVIDVPEGEPSGEIAATRLTGNDADDTDPAWSPDGAWIAFASNRDGNSEIYVMNADGSDQRRLTDTPADETAPAWSPNGEWVAFTSNRDSDVFELYVMRADGSEVWRITDDSEVNAFVNWRPF